MSTHTPFEDLLQVDPRDGTIIRIPDFVLTGPDANWRDFFRPGRHTDGVMRYVPGVAGEYGCYQAFGTGNLLESPYVPLKPNRLYVLSALVRTDFPRDEAEVNLYINEWTHEGRGSQIAHNRPVGLPAKTEGPDGWFRFEAEVETSGIDEVSLYAFSLNLYGTLGGKNLFQIADIALIELPERPLQPFAPGEGVTFAGGPGKIPIAIESVEDVDGRLVIVSTAARCVLDRQANTITLEQRVDEQRVLAVCALSLPLGDLELVRQDDQVAVGVGPNLTIGVQCDGLLVLSGHDELTVTVENRFGGRWNRLRSGHLVSVDDWGGLTVHPAIPIGSGRLPRAELLDEVDFAGWGSGYGRSGSDVWTSKSDDRLSSAPAGWRARWTLSPGERLGISVTPNRPYDWARSFDDHYQLFGSWNDDRESMTRSPANILTLWEDTARSYAYSYGRIVPKDETTLREHIDLLRSTGKRAVLNYMSAYFYYSRDRDEFIDNVREWRDAYGIDGIYSDGLPQDWVMAYEQMRLLRELFPDGVLQVHATGIWCNGGPPLSVTDMFAPFIDAYADSTITGENLEPAEAGPAWVYPRFVAAKFRKGNPAVGITKGNSWMAPLLTAKANLVHGGRDWIDQLDDLTYANEYLPLLNDLKAMWREFGADPFFYDRYYLPRAQALTGNMIGRAGMPIQTLTGARPGPIEVELATRTPEAQIRYTLDGSEPNAASSLYEGPLAVDDALTLKAVTLKDGLEPSRVLTVAV